ncbi:MAG: tetratricopeptide repeat protein, partial [Pseudomonadota bacterium]
KIQSLSTASPAPYVMSMIRSALRTGSVASVIAIFLCGTASAQQAEPEPLPPIADDPVVIGAPPDEEITDEARLDALFDELSDPENSNWEATQNQIRRAWNQSGSDSMDLLARRADQAMEAEDLDTALIHLNDLTRLAPDFAEGWNKRATVYFMRGDYGPSLEDIARTLRLEPRHFGALSGLGIILDRVGDKEGALEAYRRAAKLHPHLPGVQEGIKKLTPEVDGQRL